MKLCITMVLCFNSLLLFCQHQNKNMIFGCYQFFDGGAFFLINESKIIRFDFCEFCDDKVCIDTANYTISGDTVEFSMRNDMLRGEIDTLYHKWIYKDIGVGFFIDVEFGELIRVFQNVFNEVLKPFGLILRKETD